MLLSEDHRAVQDAVRAYVQKMAERDARLAPFAHAITDLAARFKMKAIRQYVARYRPGGSAQSCSDLSAASW